MQNKSVLISGGFDEGNVQLTVMELLPAVELPITGADQPGSVGACQGFVDIILISIKNYTILYFNDIILYLNCVIFEHNLKI
jgi:hypothetical protein